MGSKEEMLASGFEELQGESPEDRRNRFFYNPGLCKYLQVLSNSF